MAQTLTLAEAVDVLADAQFYGRRLSQAEEDRATALIVSRQGGEGAYAGSFALTAAERKAGVRVFTGELMTSASARHIIGEESCRVLRGLKDASPEVKQAVKDAESAMAARFIRIIDEGSHPGVF
jgi:hypothetical protein